MDLIASFNSKRIRISNFFAIKGLLGDISSLFLFDTGAACSVVGTNNFFRRDENGCFPSGKEVFEKMLENEIKSQCVSPRKDDLKTANGQSIKAYPCVCHDVMLQDTTLESFYFDISFEEVSIPLLGCSFSDDCAYSHSINGRISITGMKNNPGEEFYKNTALLDFDTVRSRYEAQM